MNDARDTPFQLHADRNHEAVAANGDEVFLGCAVTGKFTQGSPEGFFYLPLLVLLLTADAVQFWRRVVGQCAVGLYGALDCLR